MIRHSKTLALSAIALGVILATAPAARAQYVIYQPQFVTPTVTYSYYQPPVVYQPSVSYYAAPSISYYQPAVSYYQPRVSYYAPVVAAPAAVTTRSYYGYGIFRPRGLYTQSYYTPSYVAPVTSYYAPIRWR